MVTSLYPADINDHENAMGVFVFVFVFVLMLCLNEESMDLKDTWFKDSK